MAKKVSTFKKIIAPVYGLGAAVVIAGALFKIMHWPFANEMLIAGMGTEVLIFMLSAFEKQHADYDYDWANVYPELDEANYDGELPDGPVGRGTGGGRGYAGNESALEKFDEMIENAEITPELFEKLGRGLQKLEKTTNNLNELGDSSGATNNYVEKLNTVSNSLDEVSASYKQSAEKINSSTDQISQSYSKTAEVITESGTNISESYEKLLLAMNSDFDSIKDSNSNYNNQLESVTKNLSALNAVYEMQLEGANQHIKVNEELYSGLDRMLENLQASSSTTETYREELTKLNENIISLNSNYENQLSSSDEHIKQSKEVYEQVNTTLTNMKDTATESETYRDELSNLTENITELNKIYGNMLTAMKAR